jgi:hypothetical protein
MRDELEAESCQLEDRCVALASRWIAFADADVRLGEMARED